MLGHWKTLLGALLAALSWAGSAAAEEPTALDWVGHDPFERQAERTFFEVPAVDLQLRRLQWMPDKPDKLRAPFAVEQRDGLLVAYLCDRRNCAQRNWALLLDLETGEVGLCDYTSRSTTQKMDYALSLTRSFLSARLQLSGSLSQALPNGCLDPGAENLAALWDVAQQLLN